MPDTTLAPERIAEKPRARAGLAAGAPPHVRRRRRAAERPFHLLIIDHDNDRYTIEGPMTDPEAWVHEVVGARRAGRQITCRVLPDDPADIGACLRRIRGARWPSGLIVQPPGTTAPALGTEAVADEPAKCKAGSLEVTWVALVEALQDLHHSETLKLEALGDAAPGGAMRHLAPPSYPG